MRTFVYMRADPLSLRHSEILLLCWFISIALWVSVCFTNRVNLKRWNWFFYACPVMFHAGDIFGQALAGPCHLHRSLMQGAKRGQWTDSCLAEVTILTGFLGAGKTTLLNYILQATGHGIRIHLYSEMSGHGSRSNGFTDRNKRRKRLPSLKMS